jgi:hypothetical protein
MVDDTALLVRPRFPGLRKFGEGQAHRGLTVQRSVPQFGLGLVLLALVLLPAVCEAAAPPGAAVTGVVRDAKGIAQPGALVQVIAVGLNAPKTAFTDLQGRYSISNLIPGRYAVQASAALFVSTTKDNLELRPGRRTVVNLTLASLFDRSGWLPAERRKADDLSDDWKWTLRSSANRPMLRLVDDGLASPPEKARKRPQVRESFRSGDGGFGYGGSHNVVEQGFDSGDGSSAVLRLDIGLPAAGLMPSSEVGVGFGRQLGFAGAVRTVVSYQNNPEIGGWVNGEGMSSVVMASAQQMAFGDTIRVELGGEVYAVRTSGYGLGSAPFVRVTFAPTGAAGNWTIGYRMATAQDLQGFDDLNAVQRDVPVAMASTRGVQLEHGRHQELSIMRKAGRGSVQLAVYHDDMDHPAVGGGEIAAAFSGMPEASPVPSAFLTDASDGTLRFLGPGYASQGVNIQITQPLSGGIWAALEYSTGSALTGPQAGKVGMTALSGPGALPGLRSISSQEATLAMRGIVERSGTKVRAAYRWQPAGLVTAVDPYRPFGDQAYLSLAARQPIHVRRFLPPGLEATVDITNLLAQGYRPFLSADGRTLYLAQAPRTIEGGLCLTF